MLAIMGEENSLFPAHAGVILQDWRILHRLAAFPRTRGGDPHAQDPEERYACFSPHTRG